MTLGVQNVSFVAQAVDWIPEVLYDIIRAAYHHKGLSFVRILQRCPEWLPKMLDPWVHDPLKINLLHHENGLALSPGLVQGLQQPGGARPVGHRPRARDRVACSIRSRSASCTTTRKCPATRTCATPGSCARPRFVKAGLEAELDKFTVWPAEGARLEPGA